MRESFRFRCKRSRAPCFHGDLALERSKFIPFALKVVRRDLVILSASTSSTSSPASFLRVTMLLPQSEEILFGVAPPNCALIVSRPLRNVSADKSSNSVRLKCLDHTQQTERIYAFLLCDPLVSIPFLTFT